MAMMTATADAVQRIWEANAEIDKIIRDEAKQALAAGKGVGKEEAPTDEERANADVDEDPDLALLDEE